MALHPFKLTPDAYVGFRHHFLTACTYRRRRAFCDTALCELARSQLLRTTQQHNFSTVAYCFMPDHVHVLIQAERIDADFIKWINLWRQHCGYWERRRGGEYLWQEGYWDYTLRSEESVPAISAYIVLNPVRAGLAEKLGEYPFCESRYPFEVLERMDPKKPGRSDG